MLARRSAWPCLRHTLPPRKHHVYYASRENTTITAMAAFVNRILPRAEDEANPVAASVAHLCQYSA